MVEEVRQIAVSAHGQGLRAGWKSDLRARGLRLTPQRQLILEAVGRLGHATAEQVLERARLTATGVNISTVYRTLERLEGMGLVRRSYLGTGVATYALAQAEEHLHLVCRDCGQVTEVAGQPVQDLASWVAQTSGFRVDIGHAALHGQCADCAAAAQ
jgi:Fur family ferric uptake transcriptional regulator